MNNRAALRIWIIPPLLGLGAFCAYGFTASTEPGTEPAWRIAYIVCSALCFAGIVATWVLTARPNP